MRANKPATTMYHAIISTGDPLGINKRVSIEAKDLEDARSKIEADYGDGPIFSLWGEWEADQPR